MRIFGHVIADILCLVIFAVAGHYSHYGNVEILGVLEIVWPFVLAYLLVLALVFLRGMNLQSWKIGLFMAVCTVALGIVIRVTLTSATAEIAFILVALGVVTLLFTGYRLLSGRGGGTPTVTAATKD